MSVKEIIKTIELEALWILCQEFDRIYGDYPEHEYEGKAIFSFFKRIVTENEVEIKE